MDEYYSIIAPSYERLHGQEQDKKIEEFLQEIIVLDGASVLDVGCATGRSSKYFLNASWQGIEPAKGLIDAGKKGIHHGKAEALPYDDEEFDIVLCVTSLQNFDDSQKGLQEINRVTKKDGVLLISFLKKSPKANILHQQIQSIFSIKKHWTQQHDEMYVCKRR